MAYKIKKPKVKEKTSQDRRTWYFYVDEKRVIKVPNATSLEGDDVAKYYAKKKLKSETAGGYTYINPVNKNIEGSEKIKVYEVTAKDKEEAKKFWEAEAKKPFNPATTPIYYLEGDYGLTPAQEKALWQYGVDTGIVWRLQGWYGRNAQALLDEGYIHYPKKRTHDYYGNPIQTKEEAEEEKISGEFR